MAREPFASYNVVAVYRDLETARQAVQDLADEGIDRERISLQSRRLTGEAPSDEPVPVVEPTTRRRDREVVGRVFKRAMLAMTVATVVIAGIGFAVGWAIFGLWTLGMWICVAVGVMMGSVLGAVQGGAFGAMEEGRKEEGVLVGAYFDDSADMERAAKIMRAKGPLRVDFYDAEGDLPRGGG